MMRHWMESSGWLQGSIVKPENVAQFLKVSNLSNLAGDDQIVLVVASGSCDIAHNDDPIVEFSIGRWIDHVDGNFRYNKNPRRLHCQLESARSEACYIELKAHEKISIHKEKIQNGLSPDTTVAFSKSELGIYVDWLAARYKRPAFPTEFDKRLDDVLKRNKRKQIAAKVSDKLLGIYVNIYPDKELEVSDNYAVNLLALVVGDLSEDDYQKVHDVVKRYRQVFLDAKMSVEDPKILKESQVAVATFKQYKRFNLDDLSYKNDDPLPPEINFS